MKGIGGNLTAALQVYTTTSNAIGEQVKAWQTVQAITGWLDLSAGDSKYTFSAKMQESTHVFIADYVPIDSRIKPENARAVIGGKVYDVLIIDDPMEMHEQLEIYLKFTGGQ